MSRDNSPTRSKPQRCFECKKVLTEDQIFCSPKKIVCQACKVECNSKEFLKSPRKNKWDNCNPMGKPYFVNQLSRWFLWCDRRSPDSIERDWTLLFGQAIVTKYKKYFAHLWEWTRQELRDYNFGPILDFPLIRLEKHFDAKDYILDFWLTLCIAFDFANYLSDMKAFKIKAS